MSEEPQTDIEDCIIRIQEDLVLIDCSNKVFWSDLAIYRVFQDYLVLKDFKVASHN